MGYSQETVYNKLVSITQGSDIEELIITDNEIGMNDESYNRLFEKTQHYIVHEKLPELTKALANNDYSILKIIIDEYVRKTFKFEIEESKFEALISRCMDDMTGYGFLNKYFADRDNIEEININGWDAIIVYYRDGRRVILDEKFQNAQHAKDVILRILQQNGKHMDENKVYEISYIGKAVRIATTITPIADVEIGVVASIRFIHSAVFTLQAIIDNGMVSNEGAEFLKHCINHGVSICFCGSTGSGKTTILNALLETVPNDVRLITLEGGTREFDLIKRNPKTNNVINNRVHLQTRPHNDEHLNVDLQLLLDLILKFDPEIVAVGEMVSEEAFIASETARTGHTVVTTIHTNNAKDAYYKMFTLGIRKYELDEKIMLKFMVDAFPIVVYSKKYPDGIRRIQSILEGVWVDDHIEYHELFNYIVTDNKIKKDGRTKVIGHFEKIDRPSDKLKQTLLDNGLPKDIFDSFVENRNIY